MEIPEFNTLPNLVVGQYKLGLAQKLIELASEFGLSVAILGQEGETVEASVNHAPFNRDGKEYMNTKRVSFMVAENHLGLAIRGWEDMAGELLQAALEQVKES